MTGVTIPNCLGVAAQFRYFLKRMSYSVSQLITTVFVEQTLALPLSAYNQKSISSPKPLYYLIRYPQAKINSTNEKP